MQLKSINSAELELVKRGELLPVMEHFYSLQGEGFHTGKAAYFIRLGGCDVGCHWCDVKESWNAEAHTFMNAAALAKVASDASDTIIITGGEPLMWNLDYLTHKLKEKKSTIHIETSGAYPLSGEIDWICLSPKKRAKAEESVLRAASELKIIIYNQHDFLFAEEYAKKVKPDCKLFLQPEWSKKDEITSLIVDYILSNPKWRISIQTHKYLNVP